MKRLCLLLTLLLGATSVAAAPQLRVQASLVSSAPIVVGQTVQLQLDVLTDSWFTSAPQLPTLNVSGALVTPPDDQAEHFTLKLDGSAFFGMRYLYQITAQQAGTLQIPALSVTAQPGQASAPLSAQSQALQLTASWPAGVAQGQAVLVASAVRLQQAVTPAPSGLKVGDTLTRSVTLQAEGALRLMLPVTPLVEVQGLSRFLKTPQVLDLSDGRGHSLGGQRIDSVSYRIEQAGDFQLPAINLQWWSSADQTLHSAALPAIQFSASANPGYQPVFSVADDLQRLGRAGQLHIARHWFAALGALVGAALLYWLTQRYGPTLRSRYRQWRAERHARRLASADYAWQQVPGELAQHPPQLGALYRWWRRSGGRLRLAEAAPATQALLQQRYGREPDDAALSRFSQELTALHSQGPTQPGRATPAHGLRPLNPQLDRELP